MKMKFCKIKISLDKEKVEESHDCRDELTDTGS